MSSMEEFFQQLQGHRKMLADRIDASIRIDIDMGAGCTQGWRIRVHDDEVETTRDSRDADCVLRGTKEVVERVISGETGIVAALLRNDVTISGETGLFYVLRKLLPSPEGATDPRSLRFR